MRAKRRAQVRRDEGRERDGDVHGGRQPARHQVPVVVPQRGRRAGGQGERGHLGWEQKHRHILVSGD